ncbi:hypothetical protein CNMCM8980_004944 [Aspergillus fumigatiaffinis]|nr:hypothetical protein CNMCM8980_004944 [Aspergillus fumigatiaffinis]
MGSILTILSVVDGHLTCFRVLAGGCLCTSQHRLCTYTETECKGRKKVSALYFQEPGHDKSSRPASGDSMCTRTLALNLEHPRVRLDRDKLQLIGRSNCGAIVLVYADDFQDKVKRLVLVNHELQDSSSENFQAYAAARKDQPTSGPA